MKKSYMKKAIHNFSKLLAWAFFGVALFSCSNASGGYDSSSSNRKSYPVVRFVANIQSDFDAAPQEISSLVSRSAGTTSFCDDGISRSAMPDVEITFGSDIGVKYYVEAVTGTKGTDSYKRHFVSGTSSTLELPLESGRTWSVTCGIGAVRAISAPSDGGMEYRVQTVYMSDSDPSVTISPDNPVYTKTFGLKPSTEGSGSFSLSFYVDSTSGIENVAKAKLIAVCDDPKLAGSSYNTAYQTESGKIVFSTASNIPSGSYEFFIRIFNDDSGVLLYATSQTINVFDNMTTNSWRDDGSGAFKPRTVEGKQITAFVLDGDLVTKFVDNTIYVGDMGLGLGPDDKNVGTAFAPLASVSEAFKRIAANGNGKDYRIYISGTVQGCSTLDTDITTSKAKSITIEGYNDSGDKLKGYASKLGTTVDFKNVTVDSIFASGEFNPVLTVKTEVPVTIQNVSLVEGASRGGSGLYIEGAHCSVTIKDVTISDNKASLNGGGVLVVNGSFYMKGGKITKNSAFNSDSNPAGGGVCLRGGAYFEMAGGEISQNRACMGGGVGFGYVAGDTGSGEFLFKRGKIIQNVADGAASGGAFGSGGGIMVMSGDDGHPSVTMTGGEISGNKVNLNASAVEVSSRSSFTMTGGVIKENGLVEGSSGATNFSAIYVQSNANYFYLGGSAYIPAGTDKKHCVHLNSYKNGSDPLQMAKIDLSSNLSRHSQSDPLVIQFNTSGDHAARRGSTVASASFDLTDAKEYIVPASDDWLLKLSSDKKSLILDAPIWVAGEGAKQCTGTPSEDGPGTKSAPYKSIYYACAAMTDPSVDYTIYIDGKLTGPQETPYMSTPQAASITIQGANGDNSVDVLNGSNCNDHVLALYAAVDTTIKGLKIHGAKITSTLESGRGGGVYSATNNTVTLSSGTRITGNQTAVGGSGVYKKLGKLVIEAGAEISGNFIYTEDGSCHGGGVYLSSANFEMTGGSISANHCYLKLSNGFFGSEGKGGGIYFDADTASVTAKISGGEISSNTACDGSGLYINKGTLEMTGGTITKNQAKEYEGAGGHGGGICIKDAACYLSGSAKIGGVSKTYPECPQDKVNALLAGGNIADKEGGGIYFDGSALWMGYKLVSGSPVASSFDEGCGVIGNYSVTMGGGIRIYSGSVNMNAGLVQYNYAASTGGGVFINNEFKMTGGAVELNNSGIGGALYAFSGSVCSLGGDAYVPCGDDGSNDVYLSDKTCNLKLASPLAKHKAADAQHVALSLLTGGSNCFSHGDTVVATDPERVLSDADYKCFKLAPAHEAGGLDLTLSSDNKSIKLDKPIYVSKNSPSDADGTKTKPYASVLAATSGMNNDSLDYTIKIDACEEPLTGNQKVDDYAKANSILIIGANGLYPADHEKAGQPKDCIHGGSIYSSAADVKNLKIQNLKIAGNNKIDSSGGSGGGVCSSVNTTLTLCSGTLITENTANRGGGVYKKGGTLVIESGVVIKRNIVVTDSYVTGYGSIEDRGIGCGGGIFLDEGTSLVMSGGTISSNSAENKGGGIYVQNASNANPKVSLFIYGDAVIGGVPSPAEYPTNKAKALAAGGNSASYGGGIYIKDAILSKDTLYLGYSAAESDGTPKTPTASDAFTGCISGNYASSEGGGIHLYYATLYYNSGEISFNNSSYGGGIRPYCGHVKMSGGTIANNYASGWGGAVYNYGDFTLTSNPCTAYIPYGINGSEGAGKNDVYHQYSSTIKIDDGALLTMASPIATVHFGTYSRGRPVLSGSDLDFWCDYFALTSSDWVIGGEGKLVSALPLTVTYDLNITDTKAAPAASAFSLVDALYETTAENPAVIDEVDLIVTNILKPSYDGFVGTDDKIFKFAGWDTNDDGTADIAATATDYPDNFLSSLAATDHAITLKAVWTEDTSPSDDTLEAVYSNITYNSYYYSDHDEFRIYTAEQAKQVFSDLRSKNFGQQSGGSLVPGTQKTITLWADLDLGNMAPATETFYGLLDGNGHTLTVNLGGNSTNGKYGFFYNVNSGGVVRDLTIAGTINAPSGTNEVGAICGLNSGTIDSCTVTATVTASGTGGNSAGVGGLVGRACGTVTNCTFSGTVEGSGQRGVGGIVGYVQYGTISLNTVTASATIKYTGTDTSAGIGAVVGKDQLPYANDNTVELGVTVVDGVLEANHTGY